MERIHELENRIQELLGVLDAVKKLNSNIEIKEVFQNIILQAVKVVGTEAGTLWTLDSEKQYIEASAAYGSTSSSILNLRLNLEEGIVGKVISSGQPHLIEDVSKDPVWLNKVDQTSGFITHSMMTIPLNVKGTTIGALQLINKKDASFFTEEDVQLALVLASQSALALHNSQMYDQLYQMFMSTIRTLAKVLDARDPYTAGHSERVAKYSLWIARHMNLEHEACEELYKAALLHDIGKIGIPDDILRKPSRLTNEEYDLIKKHPEIGADILSNMEPKFMMIEAVLTAQSHHERLDGSGYPNRLVGEEIPFFARIVGVADAFDAMTTARPYSNGLTYEEGEAELLRCKHTLFDGKVVDAFVEILKECDYKVDDYQPAPSESGIVHEPI